MASRRDFLKIGLGSFLSLHGLARRASGAGSARPGRGPRYFVSIFLSGGIDAIYTTDPKAASEVESFVDVPYAKNAIVEAGDVRLGPHFAPLARHVSRLAIVNGIQVHTANHNTGTEQFVRMRTRTHPQMPPFFQLVGRHRDSQAIGWIGWSFGAPALEEIFDESPDDLRRMADLVRGQERAVLMRSEAQAIETATNLKEASELLARAADAPPLVYETWSKDASAQVVARTLQRVLWAFENDLTRCYEVNVGGADQPWDTHTFNTERQTRESAKVELIARFLSELTSRKSPRGELSDETLVVIGSEIGRFPALNGQHGKDHFPEVPLVFFGAGIRAGAAFGRSGRSMQALPVSLRTGRDIATGGHAVRLDDVGATLLHVAGVDPNVYGYDGEILDFLVAS
jgi:uncharacterized protein (DUF1501 family)